MEHLPLEAYYFYSSFRNEWRLSKVNNLPKVAQPVGGGAGIKSKCVLKVVVLCHSLSITTECLFFSFSIWSELGANRNFKLVWGY